MAALHRTILVMTREGGCRELRLARVWLWCGGRVGVLSKAGEMLKRIEKEAGNKVVRERERPLV